MPQFAQRVLASDIGKRIAYGAFWSMTGTALGKFLVLLAGIICARILGKEIFVLFPKDLIFQGYYIGNFF